MRLFLLLLISLVSVCTVTAQSFFQTELASSKKFPRPDEGHAPTPFPDRAPYKFKVTRITGIWDEMPLIYRRLQLGPIDLQLTENDLIDWVIENTGAYSLNLNYRWNQEVKAYIAWFPRGIFLDDLSNASWRSYLTTIPRTAKGRPEIMINDDSETNRSMIQFMNSRTRVLVYHELNNKTMVMEQSRVQVFAELPDGIMVLGLEGPSKSTINQASAVFAQLILSLGPYDPIQ